MLLMTDSIAVRPGRHTTTIKKKNDTFSVIKGRWRNCWKKEQESDGPEQEEGYIRGNVCKQ
eukprot:9568608-Ditylum_brightwellii.AAC.1